MLLSIHRTLSRIQMNAYSIVLSSKFHQSSNNNCRDYPRSPSFGIAEESLIVDVINKSSLEDFNKYDIKEPQLKKLLSYREKNGKFETFDDVLLIQDVPSLIKLCKSILNGGKKSPTILTSTSKTPKSSTITVTPPLNEEARKSIKSMIGLHIYGNTLSWAMLDECSNLSHWYCETIENPSKHSLVPLVNLIISVTSTIPHADAYVMEADPYTSMGKLKSNTYYIHLQRQQVIATIISVLGMRRRNVLDNIPINNFYMLQARAAARRFKLSVGTETISSQSVINDIIDGKISEILPDFPSFIVEPGIIDHYRSNDFPRREQLNSALLTTLTFAELVQNRTNLKKTSTEPVEPIKECIEKQQEQQQ